jgi:hypothetical protein
MDTHGDLCKVQDGSSSPGAILPLNGTSAIQRRNSFHDNFYKIVGIDQKPKADRLSSSGDTSRVQVWRRSEAMGQHKAGGQPFSQPLQIS